MTNTEILAKFLAEITINDLSESVLTYTESLCFDWLGSAFGSKGMHPIPLFEAYAKQMGPEIGNSRVLVSGELTSPHFAAFINGASSHLLEQDDLHNGSVFHPAAVVFPAALAAAQDLKSSGKDFILAAVVGYEVGIRIGEFLGLSHYRVFHTTSTVGSISAAVAVGKLLGFNEEQFVQVIGNAATQSAGLWAFLEDGADSKQLHTAKANTNGVLAAYMTNLGLTGARNSLEGAQGLAAGMSTDAKPSCLIDQLGIRWALLETSFKYHASCRHTHPAADALYKVMQEEYLQYGDIARVITHVHQAAIDVLGPVRIPTTIHQAKFSMGTVLGLLAVHGSAGLKEFRDYALQDQNVANFRDNVSMEFDEEVEAAYPKNWLGRVSVELNDGRILHGAVDYPKGDPENTLTREELKDKFRRIMEFSGKYSDKQISELISEALQLRAIRNMRNAFNV